MEIKFGDVFPTRDFNYVLDTCKGLLELAKCPNSISQTFNIVSNFEISFGESLDLIKKLMNSDVKFITETVRSRPNKSGVFRLWCDNSLINKLTAFKPEFSIEAGLKETIDWFLDPTNLSNYKSDVYNT